MDGTLQVIWSRIIRDVDGASLHRLSGIDVAAAAARHVVAKGCLESEAAEMAAIPPALACGALDASPDAVLIIDTFSIIWYANRQVYALFGYAREDIIGEGIDILMPNVSMRGLGGARDLVGRRRDGSEFPAEISWSAIQEAKDLLVGVAIRDVTEREPR